MKTLRFLLFVSAVLLCVAAQRVIIDYTKPTKIRGSLEVTGVIYGNASGTTNAEGVAGGVFVTTNDTRDITFEGKFTPRHMQLGVLQFYTWTDGLAYDGFSVSSVGNATNFYCRDDGATVFKGIVYGNGAGITNVSGVGGQPQTPWLSAINANSENLYNVDSIIAGSVFATTVPGFTGDGSGLTNLPNSDSLWGTNTMGGFITNRGMGVTANLLEGLNGVTSYADLYSQSNVIVGGIIYGNGAGLTNLPGLTNLMVEFPNKRTTNSGGGVSFVQVRKQTTSYPPGDLFNLEMANTNSTMKGGLYVDGDSVYTYVTGPGTTEFTQYSNRFEFAGGSILASGASNHFTGDFGVGGTMGIDTLNVTTLNATTLVGNGAGITNTPFQTISFAERQSPNTKGVQLTSSNWTTIPINFIQYSNNALFSITATNTLLANAGSDGTWVVTGGATAGQHTTAIFSVLKSRLRRIVTGGATTNTVALGKVASFYYYDYVNSDFNSVTTVTAGDVFVLQAYQNYGAGAVYSGYIEGTGDSSGESNICATVTFSRMK